MFNPLEESLLNAFDDTRKSDEKLINANIALVDENKMLKEELEKQYKIIDKISELLEQNPPTEFAELIDRIIKNEE